MNSGVYRGVTNAERGAYTKDAMCAAKAAYEAGVLSKDEYSWYYINLLTNMIKKCINDKHYTLRNPELKEDLISEGFVAVMEHVDDYDPEIATPGTFFKPYIEERLKEYVKPTGMSSYYNTNNIKLNKIARELGYEDMCDPALSPQKLAVIAGVSLSTVLNARLTRSVTMESLDTYDGNIADRRNKSPEALFLDKEENEQLMAALRKCTPLEQFLIQMVSIENHSIRSMLDYLKRPEVLCQFKGETSPKMDQMYLQRRLTAGLRRMRFELMGEKPPRRTTAVFIRGIDEDVQAMIEDIEALFE